MFRARAMSPAALLVLFLSFGKSPADEPPPVATDQPPQHERRWLEAVSHHLVASAAAKMPGMEAPKMPRSEAVEMIEMITSGKMGMGQGWFHPGNSRLGWNWLAARFDADKDGKITREEFRGPARLFDRLDRDGDGVLTRDDFDWSGRSMYAQKSSYVGYWFRLLDGNSNGRVSTKEWQAAFTRAARGKDHITPEDLYRLLFPPAPPPALAKESKGKESKSKEPKAKDSDGPSPLVLLQRLFQGELGSPFEGPRVGQTAPLFTLPLHNGSGNVSLADHRGKKPIVLIFGSFT
jgi:Ca2+-binding EF-hand superfamily protein